MKVSELIRALQQFNPDLPVIRPMSDDYLSVDLEPELVLQTVVRPAEDGDHTYVQAGETWPGSFTAVRIG